MQIEGNFSTLDKDYVPHSINEPLFHLLSTWFEELNSFSTTINIRYHKKIDLIVIIVTICWSIFCSSPFCLIDIAAVHIQFTWSNCHGCDGRERNCPRRNTGLCAQQRGMYSLYVYCCIIFMHWWYEQFSLAITRTSLTFHYHYRTRMA